MKAEARTNVDLRALCTFKIGGSARQVFFPRSIGELALAVKASRDSNGSFFIVGRGSNIVFSSQEVVTPLILTGELSRLLLAAGFRDAPDWTRPAFKAAGSAPLVYCECGVGNSALIAFTIEKGLGDLTLLAGVPGSFGGALAMNAEGVMNALEGNLWIAELGGRENDEIGVHPSSEYQYSYRASSVQATIAFAALIRLSPKEPEAMRASVEEARTRRASTQPYDLPSAGSVFRNPEGDYAGRLLEAAGMKGTRVGGAEFSRIHANFIVNAGDATGEDVLELMNLGKRTVWEEFQVSLAPEVKFVGDFDPEKLAYLHKDLQQGNE